MQKLYLFIILTFFMSYGSQVTAQENYNNFQVSVYTRAQEVQKMEDHQWLDSTWQVISSQLNVDKIYLETHRDMHIVDDQTLNYAKNFFKEKGIEVAGGITYTIDEANDFETYCYATQEDREKVQEIIEHTASHFNEIILDDFFFTNCKCPTCIEAKGDRRWSEYRMEMMTKAAGNLILEPAKDVNPDAKVIIKYPNWYDHFQELGFNLETQPKMFDGLYTGTETRDAVRSAQHLQPYLSYLVFRYYNNLKPGKNGGGWVDTGGMRFYDRYAEQLWLTIMAKAPEMTLFDYRQLLYPLRDEWKPEWKDKKTSFNYDEFLPVPEDATMAKTAAHSLDIIDDISGELGTPYGIKSYKPYHSDGEDFLENYLGTIGIPMDLVPEFPEDSEMLLLTKQAKKDSAIVKKIKQRLLDGKDVMITSGLLKALQDRGIRKLVNLEYTERKSMINDFLMNGKIVDGDTSMLIPQISYYTNDSWEMISGMDSGLGWPLLHRGSYADATLYMLTIPENFADLYNLPVKVLNEIRETIGKPLDITMRGESKVSLFLYDNNTFVVESFNDEPVEVEAVFSEKPQSVTNLQTDDKLDMSVIPEEKEWGRVVTPEKYGYKVTLPPHSFKAFKVAK